MKPFAFPIIYTYNPDTITSIKSTPYVTLDISRPISTNRANETNDTNEPSRWLTIALYSEYNDISAIDLVYFSIH